MKNKDAKNGIQETDPGEWDSGYAAWQGGVLALAM